MASSPLHKILGNSPALARLQDHATRLLRLQNILDRALPTAMRGAVRVANFQDGVLNLHVGSPALATRLKLSQESLRQALIAAGENVVDIKAKVRLNTELGRPKPETHRRIGDAGRRAVQALRASIKPDDPLAQALKKLEDESA